MSTQQGMDCLKLNQDDQYANQNGRFTDKQKVRLTKLDRSHLRSNLNMVGVLAPVRPIGPVIAIVAGLGKKELGFVIPLEIGFGLIWPVVWGGKAYLMIRDAFAKREFKIANVQRRLHPGFLAVQFGSSC